MKQPTNVFCVVVLSVCVPSIGAGCGSSGGGGPGPAQLVVDCPARWSPVEHTGQMELVGDGSAGSCTEQALRDAVDAVNNAGSGGTITFDCGGAHVITLTQALYVEAPLIVDGEGLITISGGGATRVFDLDHYTDFVVQRLTIADGLTEESGAGIHHPWYGTLMAIDVRFENNHCSSLDHDIGGGAIFAGGLSEAVISGCEFIGNSASNGGGVLNRGTTLTLVDSTFIDNVSTSSNDSGQYGNGGGLYIDGMNYDEPGDFMMCRCNYENNNAKQHGSAVFAFFYEGSHAFVSDCQFTDNNFDGSPTGGSGGFYHQSVHLVMANSTFSYNDSGGHAAGLFVGSGSSADIVNCTFAHNTTVGNGAGIFGSNNPINIVNCTFAGNDSDYAPAIFKGQEGVINLKNTVFYNNTTANEYSAVACHESFGDGGGNIQWPDTKNNGNPDTPCAESVLFIDPGLLPLSDYGGPAPTMALSASSPAIDYAQDCPPVDQRGESRGATCDSGAVERIPSDP